MTEQEMIKLLRDTKAKLKEKIRGLKKDSNTDHYNQLNVAYMKIDEAAHALEVADLLKGHAKPE